MKETLEKQKSKTISLYIPSEAINDIDHECLVHGVNRSQFILSLFENRPGHSNEASAPDLSGFKTEMIECLRSEIESLRAEIRAGLAVPVVPPPPDLFPILEAIKDLFCRIDAMDSRPASGSSPPVDLTPLSSGLDEVLELLRGSRPEEERESEAHALSFLSLQMGEIQQGIERLAGQMDAVVRSGRNSGAGTSIEIKDELIRLAEATEHQSALTGEILRIGDSVREIRERLLKNPEAGTSPLEKVPQKTSRNEFRPVDPDPADEKKRETRQFGWAVGILLVFFLGFVGWEVLGWYNGGDSGGPPIVHTSPARPKIPDGSPKTQSPSKKNP